MEGENGDAHPRRSGPRAMYGLSSNQSSSSVFEDVEMAQDEVGKVHYPTTSWIHIF